MIATVVAVGGFGPVAAAARTALLPELLPGDAYVLARSAFTVASGATQVLGFGLGGLLLAWVGPYGALWLAAATVAACVTVTAAGLPDWPARGRGEAGAVRQTWRVNRRLLADRRYAGCSWPSGCPEGSWSAPRA
jgi:MFS family permease